jgi:hypothetical protein
MIIYLALPDNQAFPSHRAKFFLVYLITLRVTVELRSPEFQPGLRETRELAARIVVTVPETAVNENNSFAFSKD